MSARLAALLALAGAIAVGPVQAQTAPLCSPRGEILKQLEAKYREAPVAVGVADNGSLLEVIASSDGATWTALVTRANGISCVVMSGEGWQAKLRQTMVHLAR